MTLTLRPMPEEEFDAGIASSFESFVAELVEVGQIRPEEAAAEVARQRERLLAGGPSTEAMLFLVGEVGGVRVGWIWLALPGSPNHPNGAWIYNIEIDPVQRGKGYGKSLLLAAETELKRRGVARIGLNVFGRNTVARELYSSLGYEVVSQNMSKQL